MLSARFQCCLELRSQAAIIECGIVAVREQDESLSTLFWGHSGSFSGLKTRPTNKTTKQTVCLKPHFHRGACVHGAQRRHFSLQVEWPTTDKCHRDANWHNPPDGKKITINLWWGWGSLLCKIARATDISEVTRTNDDHRLSPKAL